ncbi:MAG: hypoxanthine phosphoribosyltransferase [Bacillota bacterium]
MSETLEVLLDRGRIEGRVRELAKMISEDYQGRVPLMVGILKGAVIFLSDLARALDIPVALDFMAVSSYGQSSETSGVVRILKDLDENIEGRDVIVVEDIVDTGLTLRYLCDALKARNPASLRVCVLLDKPSRRLVEVDVHYRGFEIPDAFVVGYGLDYQERYRSLPHVGRLKL